MLLNLLSNAVEYSPASGSITIELDPDRITIANAAPGLLQSDVSRLFDRFWRADSSRTTPDYGLGLPLVKRFALIHNASIEVESQKGKGSLFRVRFPLDKETLERYDLE